MKNVSQLKVFSDSHFNVDEKNVQKNPLKYNNFSDDEYSSQLKFSWKFLHGTRKFNKFVAL